MPALSLLILLLVNVLRPARHKISHFGDVPQANLLAWYGRTNPDTTKAHIHQSKEMYCNTKYTQKLKPGFVASYYIRPGNGVGLFWFWRFINLSFTYLLGHLVSYLQPQTYTRLSISIKLRYSRTVSRHTGRLWLREPPRCHHQSAELC